MSHSLSSKNHIRHLLAQHELYPKKHFGQNFLTDAHVLAKIVSAANLDPTDHVLEIGPGLGVLTMELATRATQVTAVEIDAQLAEILRTSMPPNVEIINDDVLKIDFSNIINGPVKVVANLPYYITSPVIFGLLEQGLNISNMVVMVQKEVADRFLATPATKAYGIPTVALAYWGRASLVANVPPHSFHPRPDVHSAVIKIDVEPRTDIDHARFMPIVRAAFTNRRKTLANCLSAALHMPKNDAHKLIERAGLSSTVRGEALNFEHFKNLYEVFKNESSNY